MGIHFRAATFCLLLAAGLTATPAIALRLCMLPPALPFEEGDARFATLERMVGAHFEKDRIEVVPSSEVEPLLEAVDARSGAIFDPATGRIDPDRRAALDADREQTVRDSLGCAGFVQISLRQVYAWYGGASASWDGQTAQVNSGARIAGQVLLGLASGVYVYENGWIPALSLFVRVSDFAGNDVAFRSAGVEVLQKFTVSTGHDVLPVDRWLAEEETIEEAITLALGEGIERLRSDGRPDARSAPDFEWE